MKIIKKGIPPEKREYTGECSNCDTVFEFERGEARYTSDQRDGDFLQISCPVCSHTVSVDINERGR